MRYFHYNVLYILTKMFPVVSLHLRVSSYGYPGGLYQVAAHQCFTPWRYAQRTFTAATVAHRRYHTYIGTKLLFVFKPADVSQLT